METSVLAPGCWKALAPRNPPGRKSRNAIHWLDGGRRRRQLPAGPGRDPVRPVVPLPILTSHPYPIHVSTNGIGRRQKRSTGAPTCTCGLEPGPAIANCLKQDGASRAEAPLRFRREARGHWRRGRSMLRPYGKRISAARGTARGIKRRLAPFAQGAKIAAPREAKIATPYRHD
jgi:hypothetical protein